MFDAELLTALDATEEVQSEGRSAVIRRAVAEYLRRRRRTETREQYEKAYGDSSGLGEEFADWEDEGVWPEVAAAGSSPGEMRERLESRSRVLGGESSSDAVRGVRAAR